MPREWSRGSRKASVSIHSGPKFSIVDDGTELPRNLESDIW